MVLPYQSYHMVFWDPFSYARAAKLRVVTPAGDKKLVAQLTAGDSFGEAALLLQAPSPISIKATSACRSTMGAMGEELQKMEKLEGISMDRLKDGESPTCGISMD
jgi:hypothetical protein